MLILVEKDTEPLLFIYSVDGLPVDITGFAFTLKIGYTVPRPIAGEIYNAAAGVVLFDPGPDDLLPGDFPGEVLVVNTTGREKTLKTDRLRILLRLP